MKFSFANAKILTLLNWIRKEQGCSCLVEYSLSDASVNCECLRIWAGTTLSQTLSNGHYIVIFLDNN